MNGGRPRRAALALGLLALAHPAASQSAPTRILVDGRPVPVGAAPAVERDGQIFVPILPVARELGDDVETDAAAQRLRVRLASTGEGRVFDRVTGELRRDGMVLAIRPSSAGVLIAPRAEEQLVPLDLLALLLDVSVRVDLADGTLVVTRDAAAVPGPVVRQRFPAELDSVDYQTSFHRRSDAASRGLSLGMGASVYDGSLDVRTDWAGGDAGRFLEFTSGSARLQRAAGQVYTAGDLQIGARFRSFSAPLRGFDASLPLGSDGSRLELFAGGAASGAEVGLGELSRRLYETPTVGASWQSNPGATGRGPRFGMAALHFDAQDGSGTLVAQTFGLRTARHVLQAEAALGLFDDELPGSRAARDFAVEVTDGMRWGRHDLVVRGSTVGERFRGPAEDPSRAGRDELSASWSGRVARGLSLSSGLARTREHGRPDGAASSFTAGLSWSDPTLPTPAVTVYASRVRGGTASDQDVLQVNLFHEIGRFRPFLSHNRIASPVAGALDSTTLGTDWDLREHGSLKLTETVTESRLASGWLEWFSRPMVSNRLQLSGGLGHVRGGSDDEAGTETTLLASRLALQGRIGRDTSVTLTYYDSGDSPEISFTIGGAVFRRPARPGLRASGPAAPRDGAASSRFVGRLYNDRNADGRFDPQVDEPLSRVRLWLDGSLVAETGADGGYRFDSVPPGEHAITLDFASVRADLTPLASLERRVSLPPRVEYALDFGFAQTGSVEGRVWYDENGNGVWDEGELPASDVRVLCGCGRDTLTSADGAFVMAGLLAGRVVLSLDMQGVREGHVARPAQIDVEVVPGRWSSGLLIAVRRAERQIQQRTIGP